MFYLFDVLPVKRAMDEMMEMRERAQQTSHTQGCPASEAHAATPKARTATTARMMARRMVMKVRIGSKVKVLTTDFAEVVESERTTLGCKVGLFGHKVEHVHKCFWNVNTLCEFEFIAQ